MTAKIFSLLLILLHLGLYSQISLTADEHLPQLGDTYEQRSISFTSNIIDTEPSGENVMWDFSDLETSAVNTFTINQSNNPEFPEAEISFPVIRSIYGMFQGHFGITSQALTYYGTQGGEGEMIFQDGQDRLRFPFTYNDNYTDAFSGEVTLTDQLLEKAGTIEVTGDAYGTLITPEGTYENTLRVEIIKNSEITHENGNVAETQIDTIYNWYQEDISFPIMTYTYSYSSIATFPYESISYLTDESLKTSEISGERVEVFPNPVGDHLQIGGIQNEVFQVEVIGMTGKIFIRDEGTERLKMSGIPSGIYLLKISLEDGSSFTKKIVKK